MSVKRVEIRQVNGIYIAMLVRALTPIPIAQPNLLPQSEVVRLVRTYAQERPRRIPANALSEIAGVSIKSLNDIRRSGMVSMAATRKLSPVLRDIESGQLYFTKAKYVVNRRKRTGAIEQEVRTLPRQGATDSQNVP
jgi:hypothetical protein